MGLGFLSPTKGFAFGEIALITLFVFASGALITLGELSRRHSSQLSSGQAEMQDLVRVRTAELNTANRNLRELSARLLQLQDDERRRIARELHDSVGQLLVALNMNLSRVRADIDRLAQASTLLTDSDALVEQVSKEVRTISHLLHPPLLDQAGLLSALQWYVDGFGKRSGIRVELRFSQDLGRLPDDIETAIFRVVQESLTNIHRHSGSLVAKVHVRRFKRQIVVGMADQGRGIPPEKLKGIVSGGVPGVGIRGMRERLRQLGGDLQLHSSSKGTVLTATVPLDQGVLTADIKESSGSTSSAAA